VVHDTVTANEFISNAADNTRGATVGNTADPSGVYLAAGKLWFNNTTNLMKVRNGDNSATLTYYPNGTMTNTKYCIYTTGTGIVCDTTPAGGGDMSAGSAYGGLIFGDTYPPDAEGEIGYSTDVIQYFGTSAVRTLATLEKANAWTLAQTFTAAPVANAGADVKNGATGAGFIRFFEDSDNGSNSVTLAGAASTADVTITLPAIAGTVALTADPVFTSSLQLPNGANPTVDAAGEIAVDTSATVGAGIRVYAHATYGAVTLPLLQTRCTTIDNVIATSDYPIERFPVAITIRAVHLYQVGATNVIGQLDECTAAATCTAVDSADITGTADTNVDDDGTLSNPGIAAGARIWWRTTSVSGTNTSTQVCFDFTYDAVN
jgi:hypothetical protein